MLWGFTFGGVFVLGVIHWDVLGVGTMLEKDTSGLATFMLFFQSMLTFGGVAMGVAVMNLAEDDSHGPYGMVTSEDVSRVLGWDADRSKRALELLLGKGMVWLDLHRGESSYFFPSLWKQGSAARQ